MRPRAVDRRLRIDASYSQEVRTTRVLVEARSTFAPPQLLLENPLPRRRHLRIFHMGMAGSPATNVPVVLGNPDVRWVGTTGDIGFELHRSEELVLEVDDTVAIYVTRSSTEPAENLADLRVWRSHEERAMDISTALETCRGVRATFTRTCKLQATTDRTLGSDGTPAPFGSLDTLRSRAGVLIQFLRAHDQFGAIYVRGDPRSPPPPFTAPKDSSPLRNDAGAKPEQRRRNRMLFLHVTARVPLYLQSAPTPRGGEVLEL